mmetsp:Transcript_110594/g.174236  ORF Transcript_110594/g.174236 Transcript_110594/m.174236 type:complete len:85 (-) Transcript_110594:31-285(-)
MSQRIASAALSYPDTSWDDTFHIGSKGSFILVLDAGGSCFPRKVLLHQIDELPLLYSCSLIQFLIQRCSAELFLRPHLKSQLVG